MENSQGKIDKSILQEERVIDWSLILKKINLALGNDIYESWIKNINLKKEYNHYVILSTPTRFMRDWVVSRYVDKILDILKVYKKSIERIEFIIDEKSQKINQDKFQTYYPTNINTNNNVTSIENSLLNYNRLDPKKNFENFIVGESNNLAFTAAKKVCDKKLNYNPLFIYGGVGMGKTHLLNSIGLKMKENSNIMFISAERFMYHFIKSLKNNEMVKFKDFFRNADFFIIDDIQFVRGKEVMQEEFFHTFNALMDKGSQLVISSDRSPTNLDRIQDRIKSRLSGGLVVDIQPSDYDLRLNIIKSKFLEIQNTFPDTLNLSDDVLKFLSSEIRASVREIIGVLNRILAFSRIYKKSPNIYECKLILKDIIGTNNNQISIENIQKVVAQHFNISLNEMLSARRSRSLVRPRQIAMYLSKKYTTKSLPDIGRNFSGRDHTTVIHAVKTVDKLMHKDNDILQSIDLIKKKFLKVY